MPKPSTLENSAVPLVKLREKYSFDFKKKLTAIDGKKCVFVDKDLLELFPHLFLNPQTIFNECDVVDYHVLSTSKEFTQDENPVDRTSSKYEHVIYFAFSRIKTMKCVIEHLEKLICLPDGDKNKFYIYAAPSWTAMCKEVWNLYGLRKEITHGELDIGFVPIDEDLLILNERDCLQQCYLNYNHSSLSVSSLALYNLEIQFGKFRNVKFKGQLAKSVWKNTMSLRGKNKQSLEKTDKSFSTLVILDRKSDLITPMCTSLTYEALLNDVVGIANGLIQVNPSIIPDESEHTKPNIDDPAKEKITTAKEKITLALNSNDELFTTTRNMSIQELGAWLHEQALGIRTKMNDFRVNSENSTITEIHEFVKDMPDLKREYHSLQQHINLAELVQIETKSKAFKKHWELERSILEGISVYDEIEELIWQRVAFTQALRLLCLQSLTCGGILESKFESMKTLILRTYGYDKLFVLLDLEKLGLLRKQASQRNSFVEVKESLELLNEEVSMMKPKDISYTTGGYAPLLVRLFEKMINTSSMQSISTVLQQIPGPIGEVSAIKGKEEAKQKTILVFFIGGITYTEIAALRFISKKENYRLIIASTSIISGKEMLTSIIDEPQTE